MAMLALAFVLALGLLGAIMASCCRELWRVMGSWCRV